MTHSPGCHYFAGPYVTSVGGTQGGTSEDDPEVAASISGGGFSAFFPLPPYQIKAVRAFLRGFGNKYRGYYKFVHGLDLT